MGWAEAEPCMCMRPDQAPPRRHPHPLFPPPPLSHPVTAPFCALLHTSSSGRPTPLDELDGCARRAVGRRGDGPSREDARALRRVQRQGTVHSQCVGSWEVPNGGGGEGKVSVGLSQWRNPTRWKSPFEPPSRGRSEVCPYASRGKDLMVVGSLMCASEKENMVVESPLSSVKIRSGRFSTSIALDCYP